MFCLIFICQLGSLKLIPSTSKFGFINNGKDEVTSLKHSVIAYTATKLFQHPDTMNTNGGLAKVIAKLANPNKEA